MEPITLDQYTEAVATRYPELRPHEARMFASAALGSKRDALCEPPELTPLLTVDDDGRRRVVAYTATAKLLRERRTVHPDLIDVCHQWHDLGKVAARKREMRGKKVVKVGDRDYVFDCVITVRNPDAYAYARSLADLMRAKLTRAEALEAIGGSPAAYLTYTGTSQCWAEETDPMFRTRDETARSRALRAALKQMPGADAERILVDYPKFDELDADGAAAAEREEFLG